MAKILIGISTVLVALSLAIGFLNTSKVKGLRTDLVTTTSAKDLAQRSRSTSEKKLKAEEKELNDAKSKAADEDAKLQSAQADLSKAQNSQAEAEAKVQASESQIADLQKRVADATAGAAPGAGAEGAPNDVAATLAETKKQLETAEQEKNVLADKVKAAQDQMANMEAEKKRRETGANTPGVHGTILAVNQAYNFVVLGIGDHQGVVPNSEMLVMRSGSLIGKIRISSVEPTTSIGDIVTSSLPRGVQVQPGDTVVYAGTNS